jgi:hypothetical protein
MITWFSVATFIYGVMCGMTLFIAISTSKRKKK